MMADERPDLPPVQRWDDDAVWDAYLAKPLAEREANQDKVDAALEQHGVQAARDMMQALGMPMPPAETWGSVEEVEARIAGETGDDRAQVLADWMGVPEEEAADILADKPTGRVDH